MTDKVIDVWSDRFGLAIAPLFDGPDDAPPGTHRVLLDGGMGTFAASATQDEIWREETPAAWAWSSDIAHHVTITEKKVAVVRWDIPREVRIFTRASVEREQERFYFFLQDDRLRSNRGVVDHLLGFFQRIRALTHEAGLPDARTTDVFAAALAELVTLGGAGPEPQLFGLADDSLELYRKLDRHALAVALNEITLASPSSLSMLRLYPSLAVRHAGGMLFQEAHFEFLRGASGFDLFGLIGVPEVKPTTRGGAHFTPPSLARSMVEQALHQLPDLTSKKYLTICDPACGSGAFLHEALRALRRVDFQGHVHFIGHDISHAAISMARFVIAAAIRDWQPHGGTTLSFRVGDSLGELGMPNADIIVMNPPFIAFGAQTPEQRAQLREARVSNSARGDYSMAFVVRALESLNSGGTLATLFPSSLLSSAAAETWRERLLDLGHIRFLGSIGDFGLFAYAMVHVACAVISKSKTHQPVELTALVTGNEAGATGAALRQLRKLGGLTPSQAVVSEGWSVFPVPSQALRTRATWRLPTPKSEQVLRTLEERQLPTIRDLFDVAQGVQTGLNKVFLLDVDEWQALPTKERGYFRLAIMTDSIQNARVIHPYRLFFPHQETGGAFMTADDVARALPNYYRKYLAPNQQRLMERASIVASRRNDWWGLMRSREFAFDKTPRIVSKFFAAEGGFVADVKAEYLVVMGHAWLPKATLTENDPLSDLPLADLIYAYTALFNSSAFVKLLALFAPHVAGGQYDVSSRHVAPVPVPQLRDLSVDPVQGKWIRELAQLGRSIDVADPIWRSNAGQLVVKLYGTPALSDL